jgi:putative ABC transport system permease protein
MTGNAHEMIVTIFMIVNGGGAVECRLLGGLRRYGEVGVRLAIGEEKGHIYRSMIFESVAIGFFGSVVGSAIGLGLAFWMQTKGLDISGVMKNVNMMIPAVFRAKITRETYYIGFFPGLLATVLGTALAGVGIYRRQTASLFKELEA